MKKNSSNILDVAVSATNYKQAIATIQKQIDAQNTEVVCVAAVHLIMECQFDESLKKAVNTSLLVTPDGMPLVWLLRHRGYTQVTRVYGPELTLRLCEQAQRHAWTVYFVGGSKGQGAVLSKKLLERFPTLQIAGHTDTPKRPLSAAQNKQIVTEINRLKPDLIFVGLGCPSQEQWMHHHRPQIKHGVLVGVGAAFDFIAGYKAQAPAVLQNLGLEWLFRLVHEPTRLWKRYLVLNSLFIYFVFKDFCVSLIKNPLHRR